VSIWPHYLRLLVWPLDLSADYSPAVIVPQSSVTLEVVGGGLLILCAVALSATVPWLRANSAAPWFLISVLPVSNLIVPIGVILAERTLYLPSFAVALAAAHAFANIRVKATAQAQRAAWAGLAAVVVLAAGRAAARNPAWKDMPAYWSTLIREHPESYRAQRGAGEMMFARGDLPQARKYLELAIETWPYDADLQSELGALYLRMGEMERAVRQMERARELGDDSPAARQNLTVAYLSVRRYADAMALAFSLGAGAGAAALRAQALEGSGRYLESAQQWQQVMAHGREPGWLPWMHLARVRAKAGDVKGALAAADTGKGSTPDAAASAAADSVRQMIAAGCYDTRRAHQLERSDVPCRDPIEHRGVVVITDHAKGRASAAERAALPNGNHRR
jgi:tetratricopeptide (TPR) repeat protein